MHRLTKIVPKAAKVAVVEIRTQVAHGLAGGFDKRANSLLIGSFEDAGLSYNKVARYSLLFSQHLTVGPVQELLDELKGKHDVIIALGSNALKHLCDTKKVLDDYAGSLTWNAGLDTWVLPTYHPSVVYVGPKETLNKRYDQFDILYDHVQRVGQLASGERPYPPIEGHQVDYEWLGHVGSRGYGGDDKVWSGYFEWTKDEVNRQVEVISQWVNRLESGESITFALDTESYNLDHLQPMTMIQVYDGEKAYAFNWGVVDMWKTGWRQLLLHPNANWVLHNEKHDRKMIKRWLDVVLQNTVDTMCLALGVTEKARQVGLKYRSRQDQDAPFYEEELDEWLDQQNINYGHIRPDVLAEYGCKDVFYTFNELPILAKWVAKEGTGKAVKELLLPAQATFADMEYQGILIDLEYAKTTSAEWEPKIDAAIKEVQEYARSVGFPTEESGIGASYKAVCECVPVRGQFHLEGLRCTSFAKRLRDVGIEAPSCGVCKNKRYVTKYDRTLNVNSPQQMQHLCYDILNMKPLPHEEKRTTNKDFWELNGNHRLATLVAEYKELQYLRRNFLEGIQRFIAEDGRVHPDFLLFGTKTGRLAVHRPAVQTLPQHSANAKEVKRLFLADDEDCLIVNCDYKALEMFMAYHLTGDEKLLENLTGEWDIHVALAAVIYEKNPEDVTPDERQSVKSVNFGAGYGISGFKLSLDPAMEKATGGDPDVAQEFIDGFWGLYSTWAAKCDEWRAQAQSEFYLTTEMGRKRRWNLITKDNHNKVNNQAINFPGQSMASDLCLSSLIKLHWMLQDREWGRVLLTVHDSLVFNIRREFLHEAVALIEKEMTTPPFETKAPFAVDISVGVNYGQQESYDPERDYARAS